MRNKASRGMSVSKTQLVNMAVRSVRMHKNLSEFWEYVHACREIGMVKHSDDQIQVMLDGYGDLVYDRGFSLREEDDKVPNYTPAEERESGAIRWSKAVEGSALSGLVARSIDLSPLIREIPDYMRLFVGTKPMKVYLIEHTLKVHPGLIFQPLFKVVGIYGHHGQQMANRTGQLFIIGRDAHTRDPFALGIPNGFIDRSVEVCLRWTMNLHKGDIIEEI